MNKLKYPSFVDRYFKKYFFKFKDAKDEDVCLLAHSNKICVLTISPKHKLLTEGPIKSVNFDVSGKNIAKEVGVVHGKKKLDAIKTHPYKTICNIVSGNGTTYRIKCGVQGKLLEVNERLMENPTLIDNKSGTDGYICVILLTRTRDLSQSKDLLNLEQYEQGVEPSTTETTDETNCGDTNDGGIKDSKDDQNDDDKEATSAKKIKIEET